MFFVCIGLLLMIFSIGYPIAIAQRSSTTTNPIHIDKSLFLSSTAAEDIPTRIVIPSLQIDIPVTPSRVVNGYWELSDTTASYGLGSSYPGGSGNVVIFAHARKGLFLPLRDIQKNAAVYVFTRSRWYHYSVATITTVDPTNVSVIAQTSQPRLTLFTCSGFVDEKRLIVTAKPSDATLPTVVNTAN